MNDGPRETAAGLQDGKGQPHASQSKANKQVAEQLLKPERQQDDYSTRAKGTRHGKVTADNWNQ